MDLLLLQCMGLGKVKLHFWADTSSLESLEMAYQSGHLLGTVNFLSHTLNIVNTK